MQSVLHLVDNGDMSNRNSSGEELLAELNALLGRPGGTVAGEALAAKPTPPVPNFGRKCQ